MTFKITVLTLFFTSQVYCQVKDSIALTSKVVAISQDSLPIKFAGLYINEPNEDAITTFTKFITCFRFPDELRAHAPIEFTKLNFKGVKSVKVIDDGFTVPTYYAEFDTLGRYKRINYYEVYASPPYYTLTFEYNKNGKFAEVINTYGNKAEPFLDFYAKEDTIILIGNYPSLIYQDAFDIYKRAFYNEESHLFDKAKAEALDEKYQYCIKSDTHCTYSTLSENVYQYDYDFPADEQKGYEIIYYNTKNQVVKVEKYEKGGSKRTISVLYKYYSEQK